MAKRFTATEKWDKVWFRKLKPEHKCFWMYLIDRCNHAGVWEVDFELAEMYIGCKLNEPELKQVFEKQFVVLNDGSRWFIKDFVDFQYGVLNPENRAHASVISILTKEGAYKGLTRSLQGRKDKDKDKDMVKDKDKEEDFLTTLKTNPAYTHISIDTELSKMDAWLSVHKGRQKTKSFIINWLNKIEKPFTVVSVAKPVNNIVNTVKQWEKDAASPDEDCRKKLKDLVHKIAKK